ncbi:ABC transporter permease [Saccharothrix saharensis]|uniref:ABC transporter permease n=1 Tax=Saccharothrix saharensis TaxID=571190 RepID=UPI003689E50A
MTGLARLTATESKLFFRSKPSVGYAIVVPIAVLLIFGLIPSFRAAKPEYDGLRLIDAYMPVLIGMVMVIVVLNLMPATLASYRERGILLRLSTTPMRPSLLLTAHMLVSLAVTVGTSAIMIVLGAVLFDTALLPGHVLGFLVPYALTATSMISIGLLIAARASSELAAFGAGFGLFFPLLFLAGLWTPGPLMPQWAHAIGEFTPLAAGVQAMEAAWLGEFPAGLPLAVLAGYTVVAGFAAVRLFRWE